MHRSTIGEPHVRQVAEGSTCLEPLRNVACGMWKKIQRSWHVVDQGRGTAGGETGGEADGAGNRSSMVQRILSRVADADKHGIRTPGAPLARPVTCHSVGHTGGRLVCDCEDVSMRNYAFLLGFMRELSAVAARHA